MENELVVQLGVVGHRRSGGPWISTVLFAGGRSAAGARTRLHFDQVDNVYLQVRGYSFWILFQFAFAPSPIFHRP